MIFVTFWGQRYFSQHGHANTRRNNGNRTGRTNSREMKKKKILLNKIKHTQDMWRHQRDGGKICVRSAPCGKLRLTHHQQLCVLRGNIYTMKYKWLNIAVAPNVKRNLHFTFSVDILLPPSAIRWGVFCLFRPQVF